MSLTPSPLAPREKKLLVASDDHGRDLTGVQNLKKKQKRMETEVASHEPALQRVQESGQKLMEVSTASEIPQIENRIRQLDQAWSELRHTSAGRSQKLDQSLVYQTFLAKLEEEEAWISEKQQLLAVDDYGDNMAAVQGLLKKHDTFETDLSVHSDRLRDVLQQGEQLIADGNHHADQIRAR